MYGEVVATRGDLIARAAETTQTACDITPSGGEIATTGAELISLKKYRTPSRDTEGSVKKNVSGERVNAVPPVLDGSRRNR
jgi:hypothetical protein